MTGVVFTFDTTHHALWAEEVAGERGIPAEVIPAPPAARARCNLALETLPDQVEALATALDDAGVPYRRWRPEAQTVSMADDPDSAEDRPHTESAE